MENSILQLQNIDSEKLVSLIGDAVDNRLSAFEVKLKLHGEEDVLFTRTEACEYLKINSSTIYFWTNAKKLKSYKIGNRVYYKKLELDSALTLVKK